MRPGNVEAVPAPVRQPRKPTVLVVENEAILRMDLALELEAHGFEVLEAAKADAALAIFRSCPDLHAAVVDVGLREEVTGYDLVRAMRKDRPGCTVIIASGRTLGMPGDFDEPVLVESKPYDPEKIAFVLKNRCRGG